MTEFVVPSGPWVCDYCGTEYPAPPDGRVAAVETTRDMPPHAQVVVWALPPNWRGVRPTPIDGAPILHECRKGKPVAAGVKPA